MNRVLLLHSSPDGHLGGFHLVVVMNSDAMSIHVQVLFEQLFSILLGIYLGMELLDPMGFPGDSDNKESTCQFRRHKRQRRGFNPWIGKIPWRWAWQPTPVSLPGESHGQRHLVGYRPQDRKGSYKTEGLSMQPHTVALSITLKKKFEVQLVYNVLVSGVHQSDSVISSIVVYSLSGVQLLQIYEL